MTNYTWTEALRKRLHKRLMNRIGEDDRTFDFYAGRYFREALDAEDWHSTNRWQHDLVDFAQWLVKEGKNEWLAFFLLRGLACEANETEGVALHTQEWLWKVTNFNGRRFRTCIDPDAIHKDA